MTGWRKASGCVGSNCVEVQQSRRGVYVRSSANPGRKVWFTANEWTTFLAGAAAGEFDLEPQP